MSDLGVMSTMKAYALVLILFTAFMGSAAEIKTGAQNLKAYLPLLQNKQIALVVNQSSVVNTRHLADLLIENNISIKTIFAPEHGFRGTADAGEEIKDGIDKKSGLPIVSLYGKHKKPDKADLKSVDVIVFDIQDVGVRFYTYLSTLHFTMEAAAKNNLPIIVLDRPNPNANRIDGPILKRSFRSFIGMHPVPILYGDRRICPDDQRRILAERRYQG